MNIIEDIFMILYIIATIIIAIYLVFFGWWMFQIIGVMILCIYSFIAGMIINF